MSAPLLGFLAGVGEASGNEGSLNEQTDHFPPLDTDWTGFSPICLETEENTVTNISFLTVLFSFSPSLHLSVTLSLSAFRAERKNPYSHFHQLSVLFFAFLSWHCCTLSLPVVFCFCLFYPISAHLSLSLLCGLLMLKRSLFKAAPIKPMIYNFR